MKQIDFREISDAFWERFSPLLEPFKRKRSGENRPLSQRKILDGILYKCRTGFQWVMLPDCYMSKFTVHEHYLHVDGQGIHKQIYTKVAANGFEEHIRGRQTPSYDRKRTSSLLGCGTNIRLAKGIPNAENPLLSLRTKLHRYGILGLRVHSLEKTQLSNLYAGCALIKGQSIRKTCRNKAAQNQTLTFVFLRYEISFRTH